jgi:hypothetical protein
VERGWTKKEKEICSVEKIIHNALWSILGGTVWSPTLHQYLPTPCHRYNIATLIRSKRQRLASATVIHRQRRTANEKRASRKESDGEKRNKFCSNLEQRKISLRTKYGLKSNTFCVLFILCFVSFAENYLVEAQRSSISVFLWVLLFIYFITLWLL